MQLGQLAEVLADAGRVGGLFLRTTILEFTLNKETRMGTRGFLGFVADERELITYNHWDSYPDGLGAVMLEWISGVASADKSLTKLREGVLGLRLVGDSDETTPADREQYAHWGDAHVGGGLDTWYGLLRGTQGKPEAILSCGVMIDGSEFPYDSLYAEWGYIVDLDARVFEVYEGFQHSPHTQGRFAAGAPRERSVGTYYPCKLVASWPLDKLPNTHEFREYFAAREDEG